MSDPNKSSGSDTLSSASASGFDRTSQLNYFFLHQRNAILPKGIQQVQIDKAAPDDKALVVRRTRSIEITDN